MTSTPSVEEPAATEAETSKPRLNLLVFGTSAVLVLVFAVVTLVAPEPADRAITSVVTWISEWFGWWYFALAATFVVFVLVIALSRFGSYRLGPEESRPEYNLFTWTAMLFAAGIGIDLMFFSVAEPVSQWIEPPTGEGRNTDAAREAVEWTLFHYGITGWSMYALMGMALAYFAFRHNMPLAIRSALAPVFGRRVEGRFGDAVDIAAVLGTIFGIATSLGIGIVQLNYGLNVMFDVPQGKGAQIALIVVAVLMATVSAVTGVDRGIRRLSELNVLMSLVLLLWVLFSGNTTFLLNGLVMNTGDYLAGFAGKSMDTMAWEAPTDWLNAWTLFFWAWWIAWAPFVGLFLARISRGRTIRQFVLGVLTVPFLFILLWVSIFGNSALDTARSDEKFADATYNQPEVGFYSLIETYPWAPLAVGIATITGLLFYVTSADSGSLVMGNFTSRLTHPMQDAAPWLRIFWSVAIGVLTLSMLFAGGGDGSIVTLQNATIIMGLPFSFVLALVMWGLWRKLRQESFKSGALTPSLRSALAAGRGDPGPDWKQRLARTATFPGEKATRRFLTERCEPALQAVADELDSSGIPAEVRRVPEAEHDLWSVELIARLGGENDFTYCVTPIAAPTPSFATFRSGESVDRYYRCEVCLSEGSEGYHINGFTRDQIIGDVLDQYEMHLSYLHAYHQHVDRSPDDSEEMV